MKNKKKILLIFLLAGVLALLCACSGESKKGETLTSLEGVWHVDMDAYARLEKLDRADLDGCEVTYEFTGDDKVKVKMTVPDLADAGQKTVTEYTTEYTMKEQITCALAENVTYTIREDKLYGDHDVLMGTIRKNKTNKKGMTEIQLDTPSGSSKTMKDGLLSEDGLQFTYAGDGTNANYSLKDGKLMWDKGVELGTIENVEVNGDKASVTVTAPDGKSVVYSGEYEKTLSIGKAVFRYEYADGVLKLITRSGDRTLPMNK